MTELNISLRSVEASYTSLQVSSERSSLAVARQDAGSSSPSQLNNQQQQIIDEVGISQEAIQQFQEAQALADQLIGYLDYLNGNTDSDGTSIQITANDNQPSVTIAAESSKLSASIEVATYKEQTLDINATFDGAGNLQELNINASSVTAEYVRAELITEQRQFFAQAA